jgi:DNA-binding response OmpR family regulator
MYRIFLVEDDTVIAGEMKRHLEKWGYIVEVATDFSNVMPQFVAFDPNLVLLDIVLPFYKRTLHYCNIAYFYTPDISPLVEKYSLIYTIK